MPVPVLLIGHCYPDQSAIERLLTQHYDVACTAVDSAKLALQATQRQTYALVLVNRIFDATGESGIDLIQQLKNSHPQLPCMLVSNFPEYQQQAVAAGAVPGFGKAALRSDQTLESLAPFLSTASADSSPQSGT